MAAYIIAEVEVTDPENYKAYAARTPQAVAAYGGRFLVRGGRAELLEGDDAPARLVVIEFANYERARAFYESEQYQEIVPMRQRAARSRLVLVDGA